MIYGHTNYRSYLKAVLVEKKTKNPHYSLRALARDLDITASYLSDIQRGKRCFSYDMAVQVARRLDLKSIEAEYFTLLVQLELTKQPEAKDPILLKLLKMNPNLKTKVKDMSVDLFQVIADWYHLPIIEMADLTQFHLTPESAAKRLAITLLEAEVAIDRLVRMELLEKNKLGGYQKVVSDYHFKSEIPNTALRRFHAQMLKHAIASLETQTPKEKYVGSQTFAVDVSQLEEAREIMGECRERLVALFKRGKKKTEVYHFGVQLFKVTSVTGVKSK